MSEERPARTSMEGMIWNANHVLEQALKPGIAGIPKSLFEQSVGIIMISVVEAGFIFSGNVGTGIIVRKTATGWSCPCAVGMTSVGFGLLAGASVKDIMIFIMDDPTMKSMTASHGLKLGSQGEITIGLGRTAQTHLNVGKKEVGSTVSIAFSKGAFAGLNIEGGVVGSRDKANEKFYGKKCTGEDILMKDDVVGLPSDKVTLMDEVYEKLTKLSEGVTAEPTPEEEAKKTEAKSVADAAAEEVKDDPEIVHVDAAAEAAKESTTSAAPAES